jgi:hypothetical protein
MIIDSQIQFGPSLDKFSESAIKCEPMLHRASPDFAMKNGGPITRHFISMLTIDGRWKPSKFRDIIIDSRVHMLMENFYPCIPGWHHDDVPREREDGQPNYINPSYKSEHVMALWGDCSLTEFALGACGVDIPPIGKKIYKEVDSVIEQRCLDGDLYRLKAPERQLLYFNWQSWHRGTAATKRGFRFFIRATTSTGLQARNEVRYNANVYLKDLSEGW